MTALTIPDLSGKAVLITGASSGIGEALARAFAAQGALVGLHYNSNAEAAHAIARDIEAAGGSVLLVKADAASSEAMAEAVEHVAKIKRTDRLRALDMLARHFALYNDKLQVSVTDGLAERVRRAKERVDG